MIRAFSRAMAVFRDGLVQNAQMTECDFEAKLASGMEQASITKGSWRGKVRAVFKNAIAKEWHMADDEELKGCMPKVWYTKHGALKVERDS